MKRIAVVTNFNIREKATAALTVCDKLHEFGCDVMLASFNREKIRHYGSSKRYEYIKFLPCEKLYCESELIVILGGDGSILEVARKAVQSGIPMLGINLGRLGYMAELEMSEINLLSRIVSDDYELEKRMMIKAEILDCNGETRLTSYALNDAVVSNGSIARLVDIILSESGVDVFRYRADGVIVATPTGSTAYSMSAGGAIVDPRVECICVTPICAHSLNAKPLVFPACASIELKNVCEREKRLFVTLDGRLNYEIRLGEAVRITQSELYANLIRLKRNNFYNTLNSKMNANI